MKGAVLTAKHAASDPRAARQMIADVYPARLTVAAIDEGRTIELDETRAEAVASVDLDMPASLTFEVDGRDTFTFTTMLAGAMEFERPHGTDRFARGDVLCAIGRDDRSRCRVDHGHLHTMNVAGTLLDDVVRDGAEETDDGWEFISFRPGPGGARRWRQAVDVVDGILWDAAVNDVPLIVGPATRLLAATALTVFPNSATEVPADKREHDAHPEALRRAIAFIEANPDRDITIADIGRAAFVTGRTVQLAFRRHLETTPTAYLRRVRLDHAHRELTDATPGDVLTVTEVAIAWGFANPSRFARHYRAAYGHPPSETLAS